MPTSHFKLPANTRNAIEEAWGGVLTESQVMALSAHETPAAARIYVKRTQLQRMVAARKRRSHIERSA